MDLIAKEKKRKMFVIQVTCILKLFLITPGRRQSKMFLTINECGSKITRNSVFDCHLSPVSIPLYLTFFNLRLSILLFSIAAYPVCSYGPHHEKCETCLWWFWPGKSQTSLLSYRDWILHVATLAITLSRKWLTRVLIRLRLRCSHATKSVFLTLRPIC